MLIQLASLFLTNKLLPNTRVTWKAALAGAVTTTLILELLQLGFLILGKRILLDSYGRVYGSVGIVPLLLVWIYSSWLIVLLGAEIASAVQNLRSLEAEDRREHGQEPINALVATQLLAFVAGDHQKGGGGIDREELATSFGLTQDVVNRICDRLKNRGLVAEVEGDKNGYIPGRATDTIRIGDILAAFRATDYETANGPTSPALRGLVSDLESNRNTRVDGVTLADLLPETSNFPNTSAQNQ